MSKESSDFGSLLGELVKGVSEMSKKIKWEGEFEYPLTISSIKKIQSRGLFYKEDTVGQFVSVRPCGDNEEKKTYLGIYLGDLTIGCNVSKNIETDELTIMMDTNPAIWVPDLNRIVWGCESWWGPITSVERLRQITDEDIQNIWYVQALKAFTKKEESL